MADVISGPLPEYVKESIRANLYDSVLGLLGSTGVLLPIGDTKDEVFVHALF